MDLDQRELRGHAKAVLDLRRECVEEKSANGHAPSVNELKACSIESLVSNAAGSANVLPAMERTHTWIDGKVQACKDAAENGVEKAKLDVTRGVEVPAAALDLKAAQAECTAEKARDALIEAAKKLDTEQGEKKDRARTKGSRFKEKEDH